MESTHFCCGGGLAVLVYILVIFHNIFHPVFLWFKIPKKIEAKMSGFSAVFDLILVCNIYPGYYCVIFKFSVSRIL